MKRPRKDHRVRRQVTRPLTSAEGERIISWQRDGVLPKNIARRLGVSNKVVGEFLRVNGLFVETVPRRQVQDRRFPLGRVRGSNDRYSRTVHYAPGAEE